MREDLVVRKCIDRIILGVVGKVPLKMGCYLLMKAHYKIMKVWMKILKFESSGC